ncbi:MAG: HU family DNA-binding protein [Verrucomicrobiota bacterium]|jgi:nucleoid DNA-binding protein
MNKSDLIDCVQGALEGSSRREAEDAVKAVLECLEKGIKSGSPVQLVGFGSFKVTERAARMGRNPKTGEAMHINASKSVRFSPSSNLKKSL